VRRNDLTPERRDCPFAYRPQISVQPTWPVQHILECSPTNGRLGRMAARTATHTPHHPVGEQDRWTPLVQKSCDDPVSDEEVCLPTGLGVGIGVEMLLP